MRSNFQDTFQIEQNAKIRLFMRYILLILSIFIISTCGLFDYSHIPKEWEKIAKAECKKGQYITDQNVSEEANLQLCIDRKISELKKKYRAKRDIERKLTPNIGFNLGLVFGL